jgi:hypothetical protein
MKKNNYINKFETFINESKKLIIDIYFNEGSGQYATELGFKGTLEQAKEFAKEKILQKYKSGDTSGKTIWAAFYNTKDDDEFFDDRIKFNPSNGKFL